MWMRFSARCGAGAVILAAMMLSGCTVARHDPVADVSPASRGEALWALVPEQPPLLADPGERASLRVGRTVAPADETDERKARIEVSHPRVDRYVAKMSSSQRRHVQTVLDRSAQYVPLMAEILEAEGVPGELAYLPMVESGYRLNAVSHAGATGPWQFMRPTARHFGLRIDSFVDERRDPVKATRAAARYLRELHAMFGTWPLSLAAYNAGERRILQLKDHHGMRTFWEMADRGRLHRETTHYVPRFLAMLELARQPERYGFVSPRHRPWPHDVVRVDRSVTMRATARMVGAPVTLLQELNPALVRRVTPPDGYDLRVPAGTKDRFLTAYASMVRELDRRARERASYRVRRGDTPSSIARRFGVSVDVLMKINGWDDPRRLMPGDRVRFPKPTVDLPLHMVEAEHPPAGS